jgi:D-alanyl-D-alanine carboxypeptidase
VTTYRMIRKRRVAALLAVLAAVAALIGHHTPPSVPSPTTLARQLTVAAGDHFHRDDDGGGGLGAAGGALPGGTSVFSDNYPGVTRLDPDLLRALRRAATDAGAIRFVVNSGWRSPAYEDRLRRDAVARYGSEQEAARWVATGTTSPHVSGDAVDVGPNAADDWLAQHGAAYGLCQIYANEPWHYELRDGAASEGCPQMYADPTHDPRMQK